jgi:hypothetical protein
MLPGMSILAFTITIGRRLSPGNPGRGLLPAGRAFRRREPGNDAGKLALREAERRPGRQRASVRFATGAPGRFPAPFWHRHEPPNA